MRKGRGIALLPICVFLALYLGLGILFEYVMKIPMGFYNVPIVIAFLGSDSGCMSAEPRADILIRNWRLWHRGSADKNIITMLLIFLAAGSFVGVVGRSSAESVAYCMLSSDTGQIFRVGTVCSCLLRICGDGNLCRNDYASDADCGSSFYGIRI